MVRYELVTSPAGIAVTVAALLREAWPGSPLVYTPASLTWEFTYPGPRPLGVLAHDGEEAVGFAAVVPRRLRFRGESADGYILSFAAVRPGWRGHNVAPRLYETLLDALAPAEVPILMFAYGGVPRQAVLERSHSTARYHLAQLAPCPVWGTLAGDGEARDTEAASWNDLAAAQAVIDACGDPRTVWHAPDAAQCRHHVTPPDERAVVVVGDPHHGRAAAAFLARSYVATARGTEPVTTIGSLFMPEPSAPLLRAIVRAAGCRSDDHRVVTAGNLSVLDPSLPGAAQFRRIGTRYACYLHAPRGHTLAAAERTNMEVV